MSDYWTSFTAIIHHTRSKLDVGEPRTLWWESVRLNENLSGWIFVCWAHQWELF